MALSPLPAGTHLAQDAAGNYRYRIIQELGSGGFGITYDAEHVGLGRRVVIKELACDAVSRRDVDSRRVLALTNREGIQQRVHKRFVEEARLLSRLAGEKCPHIVSVIDVFEENGTAYYVMDRIETSGHVSSEPLPGPQGVKRALRLGRELLVALEVAHRYTALHGDIKPGNLLLDSEDRLVLIDFGTARSDKDLTRTRATVMHSPGYSPPELLSAPRLREAGAWSDLYSWGLVVYGLLWRHPWQIEDDDGGLLAWPLDAVTRVTATEDPYGDPAYHNMCSRGVPAGLSKLICQCLRLVPGERPQKVSNFLKVFDAAMLASSGATAAKGPPTEIEPDLQPENGRPEQGPASGSKTSGPSKAGRTGLARHARALFALLLLFVLAGVFGLGLWVASDGGEELAATPGAPSSNDVVEDSQAVVQTVVDAGSDQAKANPAQGDSPVPDVVAVVPDVPPPAPPGFVYIAPGTFMMGSPTDEEGRGSDETQHEATLTRGFFLQTTEVTQGEWRRVMGNNPSFHSSCGNLCPVERVSWWDAVTYANSRSRSEGLQECYSLGLCSGVAGSGTVTGDGAPGYGVGNYMCNRLTFAGPTCSGYRLPTEAEWEYAARAGSAGSGYPEIEQFAWHADNSGGMPRFVGQLQANAWGLYDMMGNVWEWTHDWHGPYVRAATDFTGPSSGYHRTIRGGGWNQSNTSLRFAFRNYNTPGGRDSDVGFRLARTAN